MGLASGVIRCGAGAAALAMLCVLVLPGGVGAPGGDAAGSPGPCPGEGDCCTPNGSPGCDDAVCCTAVCTLDPFCCEITWDDVCAELAAGEHACPCGAGLGACCLPDGTCNLTTQDECEGVHLGDGTDCGGSGGCCVDEDGDGLRETCRVLPEACCAQLGGSFHGVGTDCVGLAPSGCCFDPDGDGTSRCVVMDVECCEDVNGISAAAGVGCEPRACCYDDLANDGFQETCVRTPCCSDFGGLDGGPGSACGEVGLCCHDQDGDGVRETCVEANETCCPGELISGAECTAGHGPTISACCLGETCLHMNQVCCVAAGGRFLGVGQSCETGICEDVGLAACCRLDGTCLIATADDCVTIGGSPLPPGTPCGGYLAPCCVDTDGDGTLDDCRDMDLVCCASLGGQLSARTCDGADDDTNGVEDSCEVPGAGACCQTDNSCVIMPPDDCTAVNGAFQGAGTVCGGITACCRDDGQGHLVCSYEDAVCCEATGGTSLGLGSVCFGDQDGDGSDEACFSPQNCCFDDVGDGLRNRCEVRSLFECAILGGVTPPDDCGGEGACCYDGDGDGTRESCVSMFDACCDAVGGLFRGIGSSCVDVDCECLADLDGDDAVGILDFLALLAAWGPCPDAQEPCPEDLDGDEAVGILDFLVLLASWGPCP